MTPGELLAALEAAGITASLRGCDRVYLHPTPPATLLAQAKRLKPELVHLLSMQAQIASLSRTGSSSMGETAVEDGDAAWAVHWPPSHCPPSFWIPDRLAMPEGARCACCRGAHWWSWPQTDPGMPGQRCMVCTICHPQPRA